MIKIQVLPEFKKEAKKLHKRYTSFADDFEVLLAELQKNPSLGTDLGGGVHKIRMSISSKCRGKSGGARVISHTVIASVEEGEVTLVTIYDKSDRSSISTKEINQLLKSNGLK